MIRWASFLSTNQIFENERRSEKITNDQRTTIVFNNYGRKRAFFAELTILLTKF